MPIRSDIKCDSDQSPRKTNFVLCPLCGQKLADIEHLRGILIARFKCRRCGRYVIGEFAGVGE